MQAHEGESILSYLLSVPALGKTKPPSGGSQGVFSTLATNKQNTSQVRTVSAANKKCPRYLAYAQLFFGILGT